MGRRHPDYRRVKLHRTYTLAEMTGLFGVHINTLRIWRRDGLNPIDDRRPALFHGAAIRRFLQSRRKTAKQPCGSGRIYCLPCRAPKRPAGGMVDYQPSSSAGGRLMGVCPDCDRMIFRRVSATDLQSVTVDLDLQITRAQRSLGEG